MNLADLLGLACLDDDLAQLERVLQSYVEVDDPFLSEVAGHLVSAGGKRLRPALAIAAAATSASQSSLASNDLASNDLASNDKPVQDRILEAGVAVELVHLASLYHDDVMDEADQRRTVPSVNYRWGNLVAVVAGDFLLARAAGIAASLGTKVATLLADTLAQMCKGQVAEVHATFDVNRTEENYSLAIAGKTASLMACACQIGALAADLPPYHLDALTEYGKSFGMVFQLRDDILDVIADETELGKAPGQDLAKGIYTLPVIHALHDAEVGVGLKRILGKPLAESDRDLARSMVAASDGIRSALAEARRWADRASGAAAQLPPTEASEALAQLPNTLLDTVPIETH